MATERGFSACNSDMRTSSIQGKCFALDHLPQSATSLAMRWPNGAGGIITGSPWLLSTARMRASCSTPLEAS